MPDQFDNLQPHEFMKMWDGYQWRKENRENELAYFTAAAMSVHTKKPVSPKELLKPLRQKVKKQRNKKNDEAHLKEVFKDVL